MPPNTQEQLDRLERKVRELEAELYYFKRPDRFYFKGNVELPTDIGLRFGTAGEQKLGFWGNTPVVQFDNPIGAADTSGSSGTAMTTGHRFNGNTGTDYYSVGDIVKALKLAGIIKNQ